MKIINTYDTRYRGYNDYYKILTEEANRFKESGENGIRKDGKALPYWTIVGEVMEMIKEILINNCTKREFNMKDGKVEVFILGYPNFLHIDCFCGVKDTKAQTFLTIACEEAKDAEKLKNERIKEGTFELYKLIQFAMDIAEDIMVHGGENFIEIDEYDELETELFKLLNAVD